MPGVLVVEDEPVVQLHLARLVVDLGYELCGTAADGEEALACAAVSLPDLVLMDVRIPGDLDGIATASELTARHGAAIVFVTAHADDETVARIEAAGASAYVLKPFRAPEIRVALSTALRRGRNGGGMDAGRRRQRASMDGRRALLYSHDTFGLGHLRRSLNLAQAMLRQDPQLSLLLATGSPVVHGFAVPPGMDYVKLPSVRKIAPSRYAARSLELPGGEITALRREILLRTANDFEPDLLIVDHAPTGMGNEMLPALEQLDRRGGCIRVLGMRDFIDDPASVRSVWAREGTHAVLERLYDQVLVYGMQEVFDPVTAYGFEPEVAAKTRFVGYVTGSAPTDGEREASFLDTLPRPLVVVTIGGGDGANELVHCWLDMLSRFRSRIDFWSVVLTGPLVPPPLARQFAAAARQLPVTLRDFVASTQPYTSRSDLVVCTAGYNTMSEVLAVATRALVVPRVLYRNEQLLRAERLAELRLVELLRPEHVNPARLLASVEAQLASARAPLREARAARRLRFDGADRAADHCRELLGAACAATRGGG
jgi:predicted glycosyltransferase/CheY-like chemotaxis protein